MKNVEEVTRKLADLKKTEARLSATREETLAQYRELRKKEALGEEVDGKKVNALKNLAEDLGDRCEATAAAYEQVLRELDTAIANEGVSLKARAGDLRSRFVTARNEALDALAKDVAKLIAKYGASLEPGHNMDLRPMLTLPHWETGRDFRGRVGADSINPDPKGIVPLEREMEATERQANFFDPIHKRKRALEAVEQLSGATAT
jgi:hypothetical protein